MRSSLASTLGFYLISLFWIVLLSAAALSSAPEGREVWEEWFVLLVDASRDLDSVHQAITEAQGPEVVSLANAEARYQGFPELQTVAVRDLPSRFDELDPRYDPYLRELPEFFSVTGEEGRYHLLFVQRDRSTGELLELLRRRLGGGFHRGWPATGEGWVLVDAVGSNSLLLVGLFLFWAAGLLIFFKGERAAGIPLLLSFLPAIPTGTMGTVAAGLLLFALLHYLKAARRRLRLLEGCGPSRVLRSLRLPELMPMLWSVVAVAGLLAAAGVTPAAAGRVLLSLLIAFGALLLLLAADDRRYRRYEHHPFTYTSILTRRFGGRPPKSGVRGSIWGGGGLLLLLLVTVLIPRYEVPSIPAPRDFAPEAMRLTALQPLFEEANRVGIPNGATYLAHRAFQESLSYGGTYRLPAEGEEIVLPTYDMVDGRLREREEVVMTFDAEWVERTVDSGGEYLGVQTVLLSEGVSVGVEHASFDRLYLSNFQPAPLAGAVLFAFSPFFLFGFSVARNFSVRSTKREA